MTKRVLVPVAEGTEELEAVTIIDILRRAGADVMVASVGDLQVTASRRTRLVADGFVKDCVDDDFDLIVLPGGLPGAEHLRDSAELTVLLEKQAMAGRLYAAICASPVVVLKHHGLLPDRATCHSSFADELPQTKTGALPVVVDGACVTSRGVATALPFALKLVELLYDRNTAERVEAALV